MNVTLPIVHIAVIFFCFYMFVARHLSVFFYRRLVVLCFSYFSIGSCRAASVAAVSDWLSVACTTILRFSMCFGLFGSFVSKIWNESFKVTSNIPFAACKGARFALSYTGEIGVLLETVIYLSTSVCACGDNVAVVATITLWYMWSAKGAKEGWLSIWAATVVAFAVFVAKVTIATGCERQGTSPCSVERFFCKYLSINDVPNN